MGQSKSRYGLDIKNDLDYSPIMSPDVVYSVKMLKKFFNHLQPSTQKEQLLNSFVVSSNYEVKSLCCIRYVSNIGLHQLRSTLTIREHIELFSIQSDCEIGLNSSSQYKLQQLLDGQRKSPLFNQQDSPFIVDNSTGYIHLNSKNTHFNSTIAKIPELNL